MKDEVQKEKVLDTGEVSDTGHPKSTDNFSKTVSIFKEFLKVSSILVPSPYVTAARIVIERTLDIAEHPDRYPSFVQQSREALITRSQNVVNFANFVTYRQRRKRSQRHPGHAKDVDWEGVIELVQKLLLKIKRITELTQEVVIDRTDLRNLEDSVSAVRDILPTLQKLLEEVASLSTEIETEKGYKIFLAQTEQLSLKVDECGKLLQRAKDAVENLREGVAKSREEVAETLVSVVRFAVMNAAVSALTGVLSVLVEDWTRWFLQFCTSVAAACGVMAIADYRSQPDLSVLATAVSHAHRMVDTLITHLSATRGRIESSKQSAQQQLQEKKEEERMKGGFTETWIYGPIRRLRAKL
ncbi:uncharacterized protein [Branchiostoma lanceolatum]|uniref:uncharacterized protein n=1 Tax=Branchiostoma lanceolatum TaxID=7740 RepID=UPI0034562005